jgi:hypothetical protein
VLDGGTLWASLGAFDTRSEGTAGRITWIFDHSAVFGPTAGCAFAIRRALPTSLRGFAIAWPTASHLRK